ncbi:DsbA family protein, partial [Yersinia pestis]|nr:DsbA family protein [Yersinia pestis]
MMNCDPVKRTCQLPDFKTTENAVPAKRNGVAVHYIGDPICSWCWG